MVTENSLSQEESLFAEEIAAIKALPLVQRVLIISLGAIVGSIAMACLVFCLGTILFAISVPPHPNATSLQDSSSSFNHF